MFKKVVSIVVAVACLLCMTGVFAEVTYNGATTSYLNGESDKIQVTSQITSDAAGDVTTYLVRDKNVELLADVTGDKIVYVDQHTAASANEVHKFVYNTSSANIGAIIALGGNVTTPGGDVGIIPGYVLVTDGNNNVYYNAAPNLTVDGDYVLLKYGEGVGATTPATLVKSASMPGEELDDALFLATNGIYVKKSALGGLSEGKSISVELSDDIQSGAETNTLRWFAANDDADEDCTEPSVVITGTVTGDKDVYEYGAILANGLDSYAALRDNFNPGTGKFDKEGTVDGAYALSALAKNADGQFGIRVYSDDFAAEDDGQGNPVGLQPVYAIAYVITKTGESNYNICIANEGLKYDTTVSAQAVMLSFDDFIVDDEEDIIFDDPYGEGVIEFEE